MTPADIHRLEREMVMRHDSHKAIRQFALACLLSPDSVRENDVAFTVAVDDLLDKLDKLRGATWNT